MNLINKMNQIDNQLNELIHCKVSLFKTDLIEQLRNLIENNDHKFIEFNRRSINKRKFSSSEDEEQDKLDSNSNSLESKSDKSDNELNLNKILNNWPKDDKLNNELNNEKELNSSLDLNKESIEKSFNETFSCLNGISVQLIGNIKLNLNNLSTKQNSNNTSLNDKLINKEKDNLLIISNNSTKLNNKKSTSPNSLSSLNSLSTNSSNDLNFIKNKLLNSVIKNEIDKDENLNKKTNFNIDKLINNENDDKINNKFNLFPLNENKNLINSNDNQIKNQQLINQQLSNSNDSSSSTLSAVSIDLQNNHDDNNNNNSLNNLKSHQINFENITQQQEEHHQQQSNINNIKRRSSSDGSTTTSAYSDRDCLSPPNRKLLKTDNLIDLTNKTTINNLILSNSSLNSLASINKQMNLDFLTNSSYLSPPSLLPQHQPQQQFNELLSPTGDQFKVKKSHLNRSINSTSSSSNVKLNNEKYSSTINHHKKFNHLSPKQNQILNNNYCSTSINGNKLMNTTNQIQNKKAANDVSLNPKMRKILKSYQEIASSSLNGPEYYERLAMLANFQQNYGLKNLDPITAKIATAASLFLNGSGPVPDAQLLMNELTRLQLNKGEDSKSEITNLSINNLNNYLTRKQEQEKLIDNKSSIDKQIKNSRDYEDNKLSTTILENERISCFNVGGEQRLCLPQILTTVLRNFTLQDINSVCDQFNITCSRCNTEQLNMLKAANILPPGAPSCGLITKSDAERLCAMFFFYANLFPSQLQSKVKNPYSLFIESDKNLKPEELQPKLKYELKESQFILDLIKELSDDIKQLVYEDHPLNRLQKIQALKTTLSFKVEHRCFGKCKGLLIPAFYLAYNSRCILCLECESLLSPNKFVLHTHKFNENQTLHWGFDSSNWRNLITLTKEDLNNPKMSILKKYLNEFKFHKIV